MIAVTAPTSTIGSQVVERLLDSEEDVRVIVRDPGRLPTAVRDRCETVVGSHRDAAVIGPALRGVDALFWLTPPDLTAPDPVTAYRGASRAGAEAVATHGVGHVVGVSALGRGTPVAHRAGHVTGSLAMDDLFAAATHYRALANATFMDNTLRAAAAVHATATLTSTTAPDHRLPLVATRDIADAATGLLLDRSWTGFAETPLLGPEDLSGNDMAAVLTEVLADLLGRPVRYSQMDPALAERAMLQHGASPVWSGCAACWSWWPPAVCGV
jgi:uncharacterized protein YbjT (DUF2867 family)